jgi:hypothetical protein
MTQATGQMIWRLPGMEEPCLHLRLSEDDPWKPYNECPEYMRPDRHDMSLGYPTFVNLLRQNWEVLKH